ncbi:hypothetical protein OS493_018764 [Desmophyllum pertusum]|uniref:Ig-like domain-containing protein n=1 Tax=Desmophyllum pertusum TaxID=174260 RepID=A0A9W9ZCT6_9CNID|nr:hypothetical protein OS493_018764 [Desmophyllum pertusum]
MYRIRLYQSLLLFGLSIYPDCFSSAQLCVKREDVYKTPKAPPVALHISEFPDDDVIPIGYNITIACIGNSSKEGDSNNSEQPFWIQLFFNSIIVKTCGGFYYDRQETKICKLHIKKISKNNSGEYGCIVSNGFGCTTATLPLDLKEPSKPQFSTHPISRNNILTGQSVNFSCEALGIPKPVITWFKDGRRVPKDEIKGIKAFSLLTFESVERQDQGRYWCEANNNEGWNRSNVANLTEGTIAYLRDEQTVLEIQAEADRDENEVFDEETYLREMGIDRNWQIPRENLEITDDQLGRGEFGMVNKGFYMRRDGSKLPVAVKTLIGLWPFS